MSRRAAQIVLSPEEQAMIYTWSRGKRFSVRLVQRARIIQMAAEGALNQDIAEKLGTTRPTVQLWRDRFLALRLAGLEKDAPRPGRLPKITAERSLKWLKQRFIQSRPMQLIGAHALWLRLRGLATLPSGEYGSNTTLSPT